MARMTTKYFEYLAFRLMFFGVLLFILPYGEAADPLPERWYAEQAAERYNGAPEVRMPDGTRCDVVTARHAIEVEFAGKWKEAIGQSLHYSLQSQRIAGILLILTDPKDEHYLSSLHEVIDHFDLIIDVFAVRTWKDPGWGDL